MTVAPVGKIHFPFAPGTRHIRLSKRRQDSVWQQRTTGQGSVWRVVIWVIAYSPLVGRPCWSAGMSGFIDQFR